MSRRIGRRFSVSPSGISLPGGRQPLQWWRSDQLVTVGSGTVSSWGNLVAGQPALVQGTQANQPSYNASDASYNNKPSIAFNIVTSLTATGITAISQPDTIYVCGLVNSSTANFTDGSVGRQILGVNTGPVVYIFAGAVVSGGAVSYNAAHAFAGSFNGASSNVYVDSSASPTTVNAGTNGLSGNLIINPLTGSIAEIIILAGQDSNAQVGAIFTYFAGRYGGSWS